MQNIKNDLLDKFFSINDNNKKSEIKRLQKMLIRFQEQYGFDAQIDNALLVLKISLVENKNSDLSEAIAIVAPIFKRLENIERWDLNDIAFLAIIIGHAKNYTQTLELVEKALTSLDQYKKSNVYKDLKISIYVNATYRLLKSKYTEIDYTNENTEFDILDEKLSDYLKTGLELCEESEDHIHNFIHKNILLIRKGLFEKDTELIEKCLKVLKKEEKEVYRMLREEVNEYNESMGASIGRNQFNIMIGKNIKELRLSRNMTYNELATSLGVSHSNIGGYERGEQGLTALGIYKLADIFNVSTDEIYYGKKSQPVQTDEKLALRNKIFATTSRLSKEELELINNMAHQLNEIFKNREN
ncbi:MAG: helix-turn-helix domain-containing protein [Defluviitaleaceae bacterium]|nr:helix-turn-helix domain-containing protein [Defluviitaleaceae bacterium]